MNRRHVIAGLAGAAISGGIGACSRREEAAAPAVTPAGTARVGIQLYTVRDRMANDVPGTLQRLAAIGYREVEFAGYFDRSPAELLAILSDAGLSAPATHVSLVAIRDTPEQVVDTSLAMQHQYVVVSSIPAEERTTLDDFKRHAVSFNAFAERCKAAGLHFAYHNHAFEFDALDGVRPFDLLLEQTDPDLVGIELDLYWITRAGADPLACFRDHPGRFPLCHVKDMAADGSMADVGAGQIDFKTIFAARESAGFRHFFVERDDPADSMASAATGYAAVARLLG